MTPNDKRPCPTCGQSINTREIGLYRGMVDALSSVYKWCQEKGRHEFTRKEIKHLLKNDGQIARFGDWVLFGGLVYKHGRGHYGLNMERCAGFFSGVAAIPTTIYEDPLTKQITPAKFRTIKNIPGLGAYLDENQNYQTKYHDEVPTEAKHENMQIVL